jgi:hypothetical protein
MTYEEFYSRDVAIDFHSSCALELSGSRLGLEVRPGAKSRLTDANGKWLERRLRKCFPCNDLTTHQLYYNIVNGTCKGKNGGREVLNVYTMPILLRLAARFGSGGVRIAGLQARGAWVS